MRKLAKDESVADEIRISLIQGGKHQAHKLGIIVIAVVPDEIQIKSEFRFVLVLVSSDISKNSRQVHGTLDDWETANQS